MTDDFEDRLRSHLEAQAARVQVESDPAAFVEHGTSRSPRRGILAGAAGLVALVAIGAGMLIGVDVIGGSPTAQPTSATTPGRAGADLAPSSSGGPLTPAIVGQAPYSFLFSRTSASGVTIRAYTAGSTTSGGCGPAVVCTPGTTVPSSPECPNGASCAEPLVPHVSGGTTGSTNPPVEGVAPSGSRAVTSGQPVGSDATAPTSGPVSGCTTLVLELSTDQAVGTGSVSLPATAPMTSGALDVLGSGSFGTTEGAPVGWVAVSVGDGVASAQLSVGGVVVDSMAPNSGIVVLVATGQASLDGASVVGLDQSGTVVGTVPVGQTTGPGATASCPAPTGTPVTPTTTTPTPTTTTTSTTPTTTTSTTATTSPTTSPTTPTTVIAHPVAVAVSAP